ncbi:GNAT family N-acetyltransferase [Streptomyces bohaiensis]|uniref:GNAT family N-acetyltransferase n=1 Tax=Streptomyces bohaiensis TaxID=1431344 RepID=UPI0028A9DBD0|nr:GNAT family N-acetyltransferase [Streptomyces bohaiensis]
MARILGPLTPEEFREHLPALASLLTDAVDGGASVGFLAPFDRVAAVDWWRRQAPHVASGAQCVWVAETGGEVVGTVILHREPKANAAHRGEVRKLLVRRDARGAGLGRGLLAAARHHAAATGLTLLVLDTATGSPAEGLYRQDGWTPYGVVPDYARDPAGALEDCTFFYRRLP